MFELALKIVPCLAAAALLGFGVAWWLRDVRLAELALRNEQLEFELGAAQQQHADLSAELQRTAARLAAFEASTNGEPMPVAPIAPRPPDPHPPDDLKAIRGVGPVLEKLLNSLGVREFRQVALWSEADIEFFDARLQNFRGRIRRENWVHSAAEQHYKNHGEWLGSAAPAFTSGEAPQIGLRPTPKRSAYPPSPTKTRKPS
jgi:predicted flap endonuclease-1-like 5' DNA nuclease